jgi:hypothetical protein
MKKFILTALPVAFLAFTFLSGCASNDVAKSSSGASGQRLWAQNCARCHNSRSVTDYTSAHWDVAMLHMRVRANLTAEEHVKIRQFLLSGE